MNYSSCCAGSQGGLASGHRRAPKGWRISGGAELFPDPFRTFPVALPQKPGYASVVITQEQPDA
jgi:hypothetical protein